MSLHFNTLEIKNSTQSITQLDQQVNLTAKEVETLKHKLEQVQQPEAKEKIIRDELLLQKPGEYTIQLPPIETTDKTTTIPSSTPTSPRQEWFAILFN